MTWAPENTPTNPDAWPVYDRLGWADYWTAADWITWHKAMKSKSGLEEANRRFIEAWSQESVFNSVPLDARTFDSSFRTYAKENGFFDALFQGLGALAKPVGIITDAGDAIADVGDGVRKGAAAVGWILPAVIVAAFLLYSLKYVRPALPVKT